MSQDFVGKRRQKKRYFLPLDFPQQKRSSRSSCGEVNASLRKMSEPCRFRQGKGYGACDDAQGLGKALPNKIPHRQICTLSQIWSRGRILL